jgi:hypothetical protein
MQYVHYVGLLNNRVKRFWKLKKKDKDKKKEHNIKVSYWCRQFDQLGFIYIIRKKTWNMKAS